MCLLFPFVIWTFEDIVSNSQDSTDWWGVEYKDIETMSDLYNVEC